MYTKDYSRLTTGLKIQNGITIWIKGDDVVVPGNNIASHLGAKPIKALENVKEKTIQ